MHLVLDSSLHICMCVKGIREDSPPLLHQHRSVSPDHCSSWQDSSVLAGNVMALHTQLVSRPSKVHNGFHSTFRAVIWKKGAESPTFSPQPLWA